MQAAALLLDSLRLLRSRMLFWVSLGISLLVMLAYASIGFGERGLSIGFGLYEFEDPFFIAGSPLAKALYLGIFSTFVVGVWLTWAATILALVSTSSIFPDFLAAGSIEMVLSKPISRTRIFFVKYLGSLLFVLLQMAIFCTGVFLCVGWRIGEWNWAIFAAVPVVTLFFSYLYAFNVLVALVTRSTLAALLLTIIFWFLLWAVQTADGGIGSVAEAQRVRLERQEASLVEQRERLEALRQAEELRPRDERQRERLETEVAANEARLAESRERLAAIEGWHRPFKAAMAILPKNQQTIALIERWIESGQQYTMTEVMLGDYREEERPESRDADTEAKLRRDAAERETSAAWIIGSSLAFELAILGIACVIFVRRDF